MGNKFSVLIIEDDPLIGLDLKKGLTKLDYNILGPYTNGIDAVNVALSLKPDVILMDIKLNGSIDGIDAAKTIQLKENIPVIFITAFTTEKSYKKIKHILGHKIIEKPYRIEDIDTAIKDSVLNKDLD